METIKLKTRVGNDGMLKLEVSTGMRDQEVEVVVVMETLAPFEAVDKFGWPVGFFERTYGALADDPIERPASLLPEVRDEIE